MDYTSSPLIHKLRYVLVNPQTMQETVPLAGIKHGGSIEYNDLTSIKVTGSIPYVDKLDVGNDYLRVWLDTTDAFGDFESVALGTFLVSTPTATMTPAKTEGEADIYSTLQVLADSALREPLTIPAETNVVTYAANIVTDAGLNVIVEPSETMLSTSKVFDAGTAPLEIVNELMKVAGFSSARVDGFGNVILRPYRDPTGTAPVITLDTGARTVLIPELEHELNTFTVPNVIVAVMSNDEECMTAVAINADPANRYSTVNRGREIVESVTVSDIPSQAALKEYAESVLQSKTTAVESLTIRHLFRPYETGDTVRVVVPQIDFIGQAASRSLKLDRTMMVEARIRKFVRF